MRLGLKAIVVIVVWGLLPMQSVALQSALTCQELMEREETFSVGSFSDIWYAPSEDDLRQTEERRDVLRRAQQVCAPDFPNVTARAYVIRAYVETQLRNFETMATIFDRLFRRYGRAPTDTSSLSSESFVMIYEYRAFLYYQTGDLATAAESYSRALEAVPEDNVSEAVGLMRSLALAHKRMGDNDTARSTYQRAFERVDQLDPSTETYRELRARLLFSHAEFLVGLPSTDRDSSMWAQAEAELRESLELAPQPGTAHRANRLGLLAEVRANQGHVEEAIRLNTDAIEEARTVSASREIAFLRFKQGVFLMMNSQLERAELYMNEALERQPASRYEDRRRILDKLGLLYEKQGEWEKAAAKYEHSVEVVETSRAALRSTEWAAGAFGSWQTSYRGLVRVRLAQQRPHDALRLLERTRARHLTDIRMEAEIVHAMSPDQRVRYDSLTQELQTARFQQTDPNSPAHDVRLRLHQTQLMAERQDLIELPAFQPLNLEALQDTLAAQNRVAVSYVLDEGRERFGRPAQSHAFVVTSDTVHAVPLDIDESTLNEQMAAVSPWLASGPEDGQRNAGGIGSTHVDLRALHDVYQAVIAPVVPHLPEGASLTVIPDGALFRLPIAMLVSEAPQSRYDYASARFLIDDYSLSRQLSLSSLTDGPETERRSLDIAALGRSEFGEVVLDSLLAEAVRPRSLRESRGRADHHLPPLPGVERELRRVADLFQNERILLNNEATPSALNTLMGEATILHLSSHALVSPQLPLQNAFVLSPSNTADSTDSGLLYLHQLQGQFASIPLVNLSGCETAQGAFHEGEGMRSLQYAFRAVGARATLSNLWPIDDNAAVTLNEAFYDHVRRGMPKDVALQQAQLQYRRMHPDRSPFFWAGTVLHGSPASLSVSPPPFWIRYARALLLAGLAAAGMASIYGWRRWTA